MSRPKKKVLIVSEQTEIKEKPYKIRALKATDLFKISGFLKVLGMDKILALINLPDISKALNGLTTGANGLSDISKLLVSAVTLAIDILCSETEAEFYKFLSDMSNLSVEGVKDLPLEDFVDMAIDLVKQPAFLGFLRRIFPQFTTETAPQAE